MLETERLLLRPWRVSEAAVLRELWTERDPRVPPHRRVDDGGRPSLDDLEKAIRDDWSPGLLALERKVEGDVIGYCGLVAGDRTTREPELAFELLRRAWGQGYAGEAARAVLDEARSSGHERLAATVWDWNIRSRRLLGRLGFTETGRTETDPVHGTTLFTTLRL